MSIFALALGISVRCVTAGGDAVSADAVKVETLGDASTHGVESACCILTALKDGPQQLRIEATLPLVGDETHLFDRSARFRRTFLQLCDPVIHVFRQ